jgi:radical SAM protein with 4Fe4S-binding SPASM domain
MRCAGGNGIPGIAYSAFAARIGARVSLERLPLDGTLELTFRCNLQCAHCFVREPSADPAARRQELATAEVLRLTDEVAARGCLWMLLTGGEPLLRPDFPEIFRHAKQRGLLVTVFTNGTLVTDRIADLFAELPPLVVEISVYGSTAEVYERMTGVPGSFARCLAGIERLARRRLRFRLKTIPTTLNVHDLPGMRRLAEAYGVDFEWDPLVNCRIDGGTAPVNVRLAPEQIVDLERREPKRVAYYRTEFGRRLAAPAPGLLGCGAYLHSFHVDPYGNLTPCSLIRWPSYSIREGSFADGWDRVFPALRERPRTRGVPCDRCSVRAACDICVGWSQVETGDPEAVVPFLCTLTHVRSAAFAAAPASLDSCSRVRHTAGRKGGPR